MCTSKFKKSKTNLKKLTYLCATTEVNSGLIKKEASEYESLITSLENKLKRPVPTLSILSGPLVSTVQMVLKCHHVVQQTYHSESYVGNHCSQYIKQDIQDDLQSSMQEKICELF